VSPSGSSRSAAADQVAFCWRAHEDRSRRFEVPSHRAMLVVAAVLAFVVPRRWRLFS
jgi:hypothetical protein